MRMHPNHGWALGSMVCAGGFTWLSMFLISQPLQLTFSKLQLLALGCSILTALLWWVRELVLFQQLQRT